VGNCAEMGLDNDPCDDVSCDDDWCDLEGEEVDASTDPEEARALDCFNENCDDL